MSRLLRALKWLWGTSWPLYAATVLGTNVFGALAVMLFVRFLIPQPDASNFNAEISYLPAVGFAYLAFAIVAGMLVTFLMFRPVLDWQRSPEDHDRNMVRNLVMRIPIYQAILCAVVWLIGIAIATLISASVSTSLALVVAFSTLMAAAIVVLLTYLEAERLVRPVAASALARRFEDSTLEPPVSQRLRMTWLLTLGIPVMGILLLIWGYSQGIFGSDASGIMPAIAALAFASLVTGYLGNRLVVSSVVDPIRELQEAINRVRRGETMCRLIFMMALRSVCFRLASMR